MELLSLSGQDAFGLMVSGKNACCVSDVTQSHGQVVGRHLQQLVCLQKGDNMREVLMAMRADVLARSALNHAADFTTFSLVGDPCPSRDVRPA
jgi:hypothetical protein